MVQFTKAFINNLNNDPDEVLRSLSVDEIVNVIQKANYEYHTKGTPVFSDHIFDLIKEYLEVIAPEHPVLKNIGASTSGKKVKLPFYMGSLDKIKNDPKALATYTSKFKGDWVISDKLDGNSGLLCYDGKTFSLYTRGDGTYGQNISHLIPFLANTVKFNSQHVPFAVRGELIISRKDFAAIADKGANARNTVAGLLNSKVPDLGISSRTQFIAYELLDPVMKPFEQLQYIEHTLGLQCVYSTLLKHSDVTVDTLSDMLMKRRRESKYEIDGIVICHNATHDRLIGSNPDYAFAFKSVITMEKAEVTVTKVEWNMSKDGIFVPVVCFVPVALNGVMISRSHGFNGKYIQDNCIGPGARIVVMRSGDVIPYIVEVTSPADVGQMPTAPFVWSASGVDIRLNHQEASSEYTETLQLKNLQYFFDKLDVRGLSNGIIERLYTSDFKTVGSILHISKEQLQTVEGFKNTLAQKIYDAIHERKVHIDPYILMDASNTLGRGMGYKKIKLICDAYPTILTERYVPTEAQLKSIKGIEQKTAHVFIQNLGTFFKFIDDNQLGYYLVPKQSDSVVSHIPIPRTATLVASKTIVFSGVRDKELERFIQDNGGHVGTSVSGKTSLVLVKTLDTISSKVVKAQELGVPIMLVDDYKRELYN